MTPATLERARAAKVALRERLAGMPELRGIGIATLAGGYGVKVNVSRIPANAAIPDDVDGVPVIVDVVGSIRPI
jgi:hypothetical protein